MSKQYIKVMGHENLYRDPDSGAIINKESRPQVNLSKVINDTVNDINSLKEELSEIKSLLETIIKNGIKS